MNIQHKTIPPTATPWQIFEDGGDANVYHVVANGKWLLAFLHNGEQPTTQQKANIEFMVRAVNEYDALKKDSEILRETATKEFYRLLKTKRHKSLLGDLAETVRAGNTEPDELAKMADNVLKTIQSEE